MRTLPTRMSQIAAELRQKTSKQVNPDEIRKLCHELLTELGSQTAIALQGAIYAVYFNPDTLLISDDPLLVRKRLARPLTTGLRQAGKKRTTPHFDPSTTAPTASTGEGSFFVGRFAQFAVESKHVLYSRIPARHAATLYYPNQVPPLSKPLPQLTYRDEDQRLLPVSVSGLLGNGASTPPTIRPGLPTSRRNRSESFRSRAVAHS